MSGDAHAHEIVIIKRHGGGDHDDHHGGAWKIAFADFMTAMMALFLVLWLTSANEKTKAVVARYFNPAQLVDSTPQPPGLQDPKPGAMSQDPKPKAPPSTENKKDEPPSTESKVEPAKSEAAKPEPGKPAKGTDAEMFKDPYAVLAELAAKSSAMPKKSEQAATEGTRGGSGAVGIRSGEAYRDPFEPLAVTTTTTPDPSQAKPDPKLPLDTAPPPRAARKTPAPEVAARSDDSPALPDAQAQADALKAEIIAATKGAAPGTTPEVDVKQTPEGLLIGLTDDATFSMFASGSAKPTPATVTLMDRIGRILKGRTGKVTIRGFTDNKPYRSEAYDNWQLSAARAHMAHYMLVRGGLEEARIEQIEGFADRRPKNPKSPGAPENRRIEILLRGPAQ